MWAPSGFVSILDLNEEEEPAQHNGRIIAIPHGNSRTKGSQYGDLKIVTSFPGDIQKAMIIDVSVGSTHAATNLRHTINADKYSSGLADHGAFLKDQSMPIIYMMEVLLVLH